MHIYSSFFFFYSSVKTLALIWIALLSMSVFAANLDEEKITGHFEWGEYDSLINILQKHFDTLTEVSDSASTARYYSYLGVAQFSKGIIGNARQSFNKALLYDRTVSLDSTYVTAEILNLFSATRTEFEEQLHRIKYQDSLLIARQSAFEENLNRIRSEALRKKKKNLSFLSVSLNSIGMLFIGAVVYEYFATRDSYEQFRNAAQSGDQLRYNHYRGIIKQANRIAIGCEISGGACLCSGLIIGIRSLKIKNNLEQK